ncbi:MAG TPA: complex I subunit 5 family protein [Planctomycetota bacterium]|nr:complex I subunit 5 family protein [Planctomycetota bacterium]
MVSWMWLTNAISIPWLWLAAAIAIPLAGGLLVLIWPEAVGRGVRPLLAAVFAALTAVCAAKVAMLAASAPLGGGPISPWEAGDAGLSGATGPAWAASLPGVDFYLDRLSGLTVLASALLGLLVVIHAAGALAGNSRRGEFLACSLWALSGTILAVSADHLLLALVGCGVVGTMLFMLVTIGGDRSRHAAGRTLVTAGLADAALLLGLAALLAAPERGSLSIFELAGHGRTPAGAAVPGALSAAAFALIAASALIRLGIMPLHAWVPRAAEGAPAAVMALVPAGLGRLLGFYLLARAWLCVYGWSGAAPAAGTRLALMTLGAATVVLAALAALAQTDLRRLAACLMLVPAGSAVMGLAAGGHLGIAGAAFEALNGAVAGCLLFLCVGAVSRRAGTTELSRLGGLGRRMPLTLVTMTVAGLAICGAPLFGGFVARWLVCAGLLEHAFTPGASTLGPAAAAFAAAALLGCALAAAVLVRLLHSVFMGAPSPECREAREVGWLMWAPMLLLACACLLPGIAPGPLVNGFLSPIAQECGAPAASAGGLWTVPLQQKLAPAAGGHWSPLLAAALAAAALGYWALVFLTGSFLKSRAVRPFHSGETSAFSPAETRVDGPGLFGPSAEPGAFRSLERDAADGAFDPYEIAGNAGERLIGLGRELHGGSLPVYLGLCLLGLLAALAALLLPALLAG